MTSGTAESCAPARSWPRPGCSGEVNELLRRLEGHRGKMVGDARRNARMSCLPIIRVWLWLSVLATVAGWRLSALGQLNRGGYLVFAGIVAVLFWLGRKRG